MVSLRTFSIIVAAGVIGICADSSSAALARRAGGSGYSGQLSSNRAIRKQQLTCDPEDPLSGSTSTLYNPAVVTLSDLFFGPGYTGSGVVEVDIGDGVHLLQDIKSFVVAPRGAETGYAQVFYSQGQVPTPTGQIAPPRGYFINDTDGVAGVDTHAFEFTYLDVADTTFAEYTIFAANLGERRGGNSEDFLVGRDDQGTFRLGPADLSSAFLRGNLVANVIPLPPALYAGGATLCAVVMAIKRRRLIGR
jgi:hypothetical protein